MLTELKIKNFAIIQAQSLSLGSGLNVISGETGAGKSIILNALQLILGARANADLVRKGEEYLEVEALFDLSTIPQIVLSMDAQISIKLPAYSGEITFSADGQISTNVYSGDVIRVKKSKHHIAFVRSGKKSYFEILRAKLNLGLGNRAN